MGPLVTIYQATDVTIEVWRGILDTYGLPTFFLFVSGFAFWRRIVVFGAELRSTIRSFVKEIKRLELAHAAELQSRDQAHAREIERLRGDLAYREQLRLEERAGRLAAEANLGKLTRSTERLATAVEGQSGIVAEILRTLEEGR
jgi:hypothetical protein